MKKCFRQITFVAATAAPFSSVSTRVRSCPERPAAGLHHRDRSIRRRDPPGTFVSGGWQVTINTMASTGTSRGSRIRGPLNMT